MVVVVEWLDVHSGPASEMAGGVVSVVEEEKCEKEEDPDAGRGVRQCHEAKSF